MPLDIYFHIGTGKTGSSAIQSFLSKNRKTFFENFGILYPDLEEPYETGTLFNHAITFNNDKGATVDSFISFFKNCIGYCEKHNIEKLVFSRENTSLRYATWLQKAAESINQRVKILVYLRRQDSWIESAWKQWGHKATNLADIVHFAERKTIDWFDILTSWANIVGKENIILKVYEKAALPNGLIHDFLSIFNIDEDYEVFIQPAQDYKSVNYGFTPEVIRLLQFCKPLYDSVHDNKFFFFLDENLPEIYRKTPFSSYNILSDEERKKILKKYKSSNNKVANEFLNLEGEELFKDPVITEEPHQDLNIRSFAPILMSILVKQNAKINKLEALLQKILENQSKVLANLENGINVIQIIGNKRRRRVLKEASRVYSTQRVSLIFDNLSIDTGFIQFEAEFLSSNPGSIRLYYLTHKKDEFKQEHSVLKHFLNGTSKINLSIPNVGLADRLRLDVLTKEPDIDLAFISLSLKIKSD